MNEGREEEAKRGRKERRGEKKLGEFRGGGPCKCMQGLTTYVLQPSLYTCASILTFTLTHTRIHNTRSLSTLFESHRAWRQLLGARLPGSSQ